VHGSDLTHACSHLSTFVIGGLHINLLHQSKMLSSYICNEVNVCSLLDDVEVLMGKYYEKHEKIPGSIFFES